MAFNEAQGRSPSLTRHADCVLRMLHRFDVLCAGLLRRSRAEGLLFGNPLEQRFQALMMRRERGGEFGGAPG